MVGDQYKTEHDAEADGYTETEHDAEANGYTETDRHAGSGCHGEVTCFRPHFVRRTGCYGSKATGSVPTGGSGSVHVILRSGLRQAENRHERAD